MLERTFEKLVVTEDTYIFEGDLAVMNELTLKDAELIVSGCLTILEGCQVSIEGTDISVGELDINSYSEMKDGDIYVAGNMYADADVITDGDIYVHGGSQVGYVEAMNYMVECSNDSTTIKTVQDVYIGIDNDSCEIYARDVCVLGVNDSGKILAKDSMYIAYDVNLKREVVS